VTYRLHPEAALEHEEQVAYYEERSGGLGSRYHLAAMQAIGRVVEAPHRFKVTRSPNIRQVRLLGFPFTVIYRDVGGMVQVLAVAHHRRRPDYWTSRV
jgi:plasmid stabilization system protein ParE